MRLCFIYWFFLFKAIIYPSNLFIFCFISSLTEASSAIFSHNISFIYYNSLRISLFCYALIPVAIYFSHFSYWPPPRHSLNAFTIYTWMQGWEFFACPARFISIFVLYICLGDGFAYWLSFLVESLIIIDSSSLIPLLIAMSSSHCFSLFFKGGNDIFPFDFWKCVRKFLIYTSMQLSSSLKSSWFSRRVSSVIGIF